jgi:FixJ family two-component response regulator
MCANRPEQRFRIAVVDNEPAVRAALRRLICAAGYSVFSFESGSAFLESLSGQRPDCVILDYAMPGCTGLQVLSRMEADGFKIPAIVITASDGAHIVRQSIAAGARALLGKPILAGDLFAAIEEAIERA